MPWGMFCHPIERNAGTQSIRTDAQIQILLTILINQIPFAAATLAPVLAPENKSSHQLCAGNFCPSVLGKLLRCMHSWISAAVLHQNQTPLDGAINLYSDILTIKQAFSTTTDTHSFSTVTFKAVLWNLLFITWSVLCKNWQCYLKLF